jgi:SulP family sulfate permease
MLAAATAGIMVVGPVIIGYIPVMVVGALIFLLGIELLEEALIDTWGKLSRLEYLTVCFSGLLILELQVADLYRW